MLEVENNGAVLNLHGVVGTEVLDQQEVGVSLLVLGLGLTGGRLLFGGREVVALPPPPYCHRRRGGNRRNTLTEYYLHPYL